jgi:endonuclease/exonuclease/phosphatase family metal-dependent hydrolase
VGNDLILAFHQCTAFVGFLRLLTKKLLFVVNGLTVLAFLAACLVPYVSPSRFWPISILGLAFPYILLITLGFLLFWLFFKPRYSMLSLGAILLGWKSVSALFAFHPGAATASPDSTGAFTVMSYNVRYFKDFDQTPAENAALRGRILDLIAKQRPDILCLQEFYTSENPSDFDNKADISRQMGLPYRYFSSDHNYANNHSGVILFSRYPIIRSAKIRLLEQSSEESAIWADVVKAPGDTLRIFTLHLQSVYLSHKDLLGLERVKMQEDTGLAVSRIILGKLRKAFLKREGQAMALHEEIQKTPYPVILCGDFNDTPNSYAYFKIRGDLQDAFLKKGFGLGRTYSGISPTLRIDYIFTSPSLHTVSFRCIHQVLSDHYPIVAEITPGSG